MGIVGLFTFLQSFEERWSSYFVLIVFHTLLCIIHWSLYFYHGDGFLNEEYHLVDMGSHGLIALVLFVLMVLSMLKKAQLTRRKIV